MTRLECRRAATDAERTATNIRAGNAFAKINARRTIEAAERAYLDPACEPRTAQRLHAAIDQMADAIADA